MKSEALVSDPSHGVNRDSIDVQKKRPGMLFSAMQSTKCAEMYNAGIAKIKNGKLEDAIFLLHEAHFFSPSDPAPLVALAECFVFLCDIKSAIRQYRKALWVAQIRDSIDPTEAPLLTISSTTPKGPSQLTSREPQLASSVSTDVRKARSISSFRINSNGEKLSNLPLLEDASEKVLRDTQPSIISSHSSLPQLPSTPRSKAGNSTRGSSSSSSESEKSSPFSEGSATLSSASSRVLRGKVDDEKITAKVSGKRESARGVEPSEKGPTTTASRSSFNSKLFSNSNLLRGNNRASKAKRSVTELLEAYTGEGSETIKGILGASSRTLPPPNFQGDEAGRSTLYSQSVRSCNAENNHLSASVQLKNIQIRLAGLLDALGLILFRVKDFHQALQCVEDSLLLVEDPVVQLHRSVFLISLQREEEAESLLDEQIKKNVGCKVQTAALLINLLVNRQAFRPARMLIDEFTTLSHCENCITVAKHIFLSKYERYRQKALEKNDLGTISKCIDVFSNDVELLFSRANIYIAAKQYKSSVQDLFRCVKETNGTHKEAIEKMTSVLFSIGSSLDGREGIHDAIRYYSESLKWQAENKLVLLARADCYVKVEDFENAMADYQQLLQIDADDSTATRRIAFLHDLRGKEMYNQNDVKNAELEFTNAIKRCDTEPLFYYHRALCRFNLGESRYGLRDVLSCQQLDPKDPFIRAFVVRYLGSPDIPRTTKSFKKLVEAEGMKKDETPTTEESQGEKMPSYGRRITSDDRVMAGVCSPALPRMCGTTKKTAKKYYGVQSARVTKELMEAVDAAEAGGWRNLPAEKALRQREKMTTRGEHSSKHVMPILLGSQQSFPWSRKPPGLGVVEGSRLQIAKREEPTTLLNARQKVRSNFLRVHHSKKGSKEPVVPNEQPPSEVLENVSPTHPSPKESLLLPTVLSSEVRRSSDLKQYSSDNQTMERKNSSIPPPLP